jgi:cysteinyl-tRNA synthetase
MHHGFVTIKDEKMSKSLGNFLTIRDVLSEYPAEVLRLFLFSTQYRNPLDFTENALHDAQTGLDRMYGCLAGIADLPDPGEDKAVIGVKAAKKIQSLRDRFVSAMDNDFNTAQAIGLLFDAVKVLNKMTRQLSAHPAAADVELIRRGGTDMKELAGLLGVLQQDPVQYVRQKKQQLLDGVDLSEEQINALIEKRKAARAAKDWAASDAVRDELLVHNVELHDGPDGTTWDVKA